MTKNSMYIEIQPAVIGKQDSYEIIYYDKSVGESSATTDTTTDTFYTITSLLPGHTYVITVAAISNGVKSPHTDPAHDQNTGEFLVGRVKHNGGSMMVF